MKKPLFMISLIALAVPSWAADSTILKEIMGESVYEESGITELSEEQLKVLERWILNNAVEERLAEEPRRKVPPKQPSAPAEPASPALTVTPPAPEAQREVEVVESEPRYVRLAEEPDEAVKAEEEEPVTQKYVLIDSLEKNDRDVPPDLIRSRIDGPFKGWKNNKTRFRLENGEIWEQRQSSTYITSLDSPEVIIRKNRFGYTMEVPAVGRKVHVRRIR